eukprot:scaffold218942_cov24-Tisochrysis_lutea.AAC.1
MSHGGAQCPPLRAPTFLRGRPSALRKTFLASARACSTTSFRRVGVGITSSANKCFRGRSAVHA